MSFFFGGGKKNKPEYTGLQLQTSSSTMALTIAWGANRFAPNLIWYDDFKAHKQKQKAGKGGGSATTYTYTASVMLALCEGIIINVGRVFKDQDKTSTLSSLGMSLFKGTQPQSIWGYLTSKHPEAARHYPGVAYLAVANYDLGTSATLPNHSFEVFSRQYQTAKNGSNDADPAIIVDEFLTSTAFGVGMNAAIIDYSTLMSGPDAMTTGDASFQTYCAAQGFGLSPILSSATAASDTLDKWTKICNTAVVWTGYALKFIPKDLSDVDGNGYKYRPNRIAAYTLTDEDFISDGEDPVKASRVDPSDAYNAMKLTLSNAANEYNDAPVDWKDQGLIEQFGLRTASTFAAPEITSMAMGAKVVALMGQRTAYVRNSYKFVLGAEYCLLEAMDLVSIIDKKLGTINLQIQKIEEDDEGSSFSVEADEVSVAVTSSKGFTPGTVIAGSNDTGALPGPVNPPIIFDVPADMSGGAAQIWAAVSGGNGTLVSQFWGGAIVHVSRDDVTYSAIGEVEQPARQGKLTAALPAYAGPNPDTANVLKVSLAMSGGDLMSVSEDDAAAEATICYVGGEFISYTSAELTALNAYDLTDLYRGLHRTGSGAKANGVPFARLDDLIFKYDLPPEYVGVPLKFKFQSYNIWKAAYEDLAECVAYDYTPTGAGFKINAPTSSSIAFAAREQADGTGIIRGVVSVAGTSAPYLDHYDVQISSDAGVTWTDLPPISKGSTSTYFEPALVGVNYLSRARAVASTVGGTPSAWVQSASTPSGQINGSVIPNAPTGLATSGGLLSNKLTWNAAAAGSTPNGYRIFGIHAATGNFADAVVVGTVQGITSWTHSGLAVNDTWRYWVVAYNGAGSSAPVGPVNATTSAEGDGSKLVVKDEGVQVSGNAKSLNFTGDGVTVTAEGTGVRVNFTGGSGPGGVYAPLVTGELPGPNPLSTSDGQFIMIRIK